MIIDAVAQAGAESCGLQVCALQVAVAPQSCYTGREGLQRRLLYSNCLSCINKFQFFSLFVHFEIL